MEMLDIIINKRNGKELTREEIEFWIKEYVDEKIPDYQVAALLMAIYFQGMTDEETFVLTSAMQHSGDEVDLSAINGIKVDKHSTGGVGDKTTLIVAPIVAAAGVKVAKMSGRCLGFTGGTADKLEAIPGFRTKVSSEEFFAQVNSVGAAVITQTEHITPADKKLYALRDVTGTVSNMSLIASSIMSKKLASGSDAIVLDVKCGDGAFLKTLEEATALADIMIRIGKSAGKDVTAVISDMNQPLGNAVGNSLEVIEAIEVLKGNGPEDITELSLRLAGEMIYLGNFADDSDAGYELAKSILESGEGLKRLAMMIEAQGGNAAVIDDYSIFGEAGVSEVLLAGEDAYIVDIDTEMVGVASQHAGAGRMKKEDEIDSTAGIILHHKTGDYVKAGEAYATVYSSAEDKLSDACRILQEAFKFGAGAPCEELLVKKVLRSR